MDNTIPLSTDSVLSKLPHSLRRIGIFGSTGSIGESALSLMEEHNGRFSVFCLVAGTNVEKLVDQTVTFRPECIGIQDTSKVPLLKESLRKKGVSVPIAAGSDEIASLAEHPHCDVVLGAIVGISGLRSVLRAAQAGKVIALANKESLVCAGALIQKTLLESGGCILPVDSEHSALFQSLQGNRIEDIAKLVLTASGGPFLHTDCEVLKTVTPEAALKHPRWKMGPKVSIDSSTMFNKALELIEAHWLFGIQEENIDVVVHPQSIVHSLIEYRDGSSIAQLSHPDMRGPIAYALAYPGQRVRGAVKTLRLQDIGKLEFFPLDDGKFPAVKLAREVLRAGGGAGVVFNAANEVAVEAFLSGKIGYLGIISSVRSALEHFGSQPCATLEAVLDLDASVRSFLVPTF